MTSRELSVEYSRGAPRSPAARDEHGAPEIKIRFRSDTAATRSRTKALPPANRFKLRYTFWHITDIEYPSASVHTGGGLCAQIDLRMERMIRCRRLGSLLA
jgi:hypothetical protein